MKQRTIKIKRVVLASEQCSLRQIAHLTERLWVDEIFQKKGGLTSGRFGGGEPISIQTFPHNLDIKDFVTKV
jgi:hypothetical protein